VSHLAFGRMALRIVATLAILGVLAACGYKGPLFFPGQKGSPPSRQTPSKTPVPDPVPAPVQLP
jgi:predicted small lipoprotein YifL